MRLVTATLLIAVLFLASCGKNTPENANELLPTGTVLATGNFSSNSHPTSGSVKIIQDVNTGKKYLVFENFRTDNGPDLRVWLSPDNSGSPRVEPGVLKAVSGNFFYELDSSFDHTINKKVLIWCIDFSVLFGSASLN